MSIIEKLATSLNRRDEIPNQELAREILKTNDKKAIKELFDNLKHTDKGIQGDCIKVIYEIGEAKPASIAPFAEELIALLQSKNNRLQWGAMTALNSITNEVPKKIYHALPDLLDVADRGSVITNDHCMAILTKLCVMKEYAGDAFVLLNQRLMTCATNQLPMYAENVAPSITGKNKETFIKTLTSRLPEVEKESKRARIEKLIRRIRKA